MRAAALLVLLAGCYASHEVTSPTHRDGGGVLDLGAPDLGAPLHDAGACTLGTPITIDLEPVSSATLCPYGRIDGAQVTSVVAEPGIDGVRIHADFCPGADRDCRCDIVLGNVGADLATRDVLLPHAGLTIVVDHWHLAVSKIPTCMCAGCGCDVPFALYVGVVDPDTAGDVPEGGVLFSRGPLSCPTTSACERTDAWRLHVAWNGFALDVPVGEERTLGVLQVRARADAFGVAPCAACADCGTVRGSWIAWIREPRGD